MPITPKNLLNHELIGLDVKIYRSTQRNLRDLAGTVVDESYSTLTIEVEKPVKGKKRKTGRKRTGKTAKEEKIELVEKVIPKNNCIFIFTLPNGVKVQVDGQKLVGRAEDRTKKTFGRW